MVLVADGLLNGSRITQWVTNYSMGHDYGNMAMDDDARAHIRARSHLQSGSVVKLRAAHDVYGLIISRVEVANTQKYGVSTLTTGGRTTWTGARPTVFLDEPAGSCITHEESFISPLY